MIRRLRMLSCPNMLIPISAAIHVIDNVHDLGSAGRYRDTARDTRVAAGGSLRQRDCAEGPLATRGWRTELAGWKPGAGGLAKILKERLLSRDLGRSPGQLWNSQNALRDQGR